MWGISELIISIFFQPWWSYSLSSIKILYFRGISELRISKFFQQWWNYSLLSIKILHFRGISELRISKFSSTMMKLFTLFHQNPSLLRHFRTKNFKIFFNHGEIMHTSPSKWSLWGHFRAMNFKIFFNHGEVFNLLKPFISVRFRSMNFKIFFQSWWSV